MQHKEVTKFQEKQMAQFAEHLFDIYGTMPEVCHTAESLMHTILQMPNAQDMGFADEHVKLLSAITMAKDRCLIIEPLG